MRCLVLLLTSIELWTTARSAYATYTLASVVPWSPSAPSSVDQSQILGNTYYLSNRNAGIDVVDLTTSTLTTVIAGFTSTVVNGSIVGRLSGPNGLVLLPDRQELYAGDAQGRVQVVDLASNRVVATIATNSTERADEGAFDPSTGTVVMANANEPDDAFVSVIDAASRAVRGRIDFDGADELEQPAYNPADGQFYVSVPQMDDYADGVIAVLDLADMAIAHFIPVYQCLPSGIAFGPGKQLFVACSDDQYGTYGYQASYILDYATGAVVHNISGVSGIDQVAYSSTTGYYYLSAYKQVNAADGSPDPRLFVVAADGTVVQSIPTDASLSHSVAVQAGTAALVVPIKSRGIVIYKLESATNGTAANATATSTLPSMPALFTGGATSRPLELGTGLLALLGLFAGLWL